MTTDGAHISNLTKVFLYCLHMRRKTRWRLFADTRQIYSSRISRRYGLSDDARASIAAVILDLSSG